MARSVIWEGITFPFGKPDARLTCAYRAVYDDVDRNVVFESSFDEDAMGVRRWMPVDHVPHKYVMDFGKLLDEKDVVYVCFWCDEGTIEKLPGTCPKCKKEIKSRLDQMTNQELMEVYLKKYACGPQGPTYSLAVKRGEEKPDGNH